MSAEPIQATGSPPPSKEKILVEYEARVSAVEGNYERGLITEAERREIVEYYLDRVGLADAKDKLAAEQAKADAQMLADWKVENGAIEITVESLQERFQQVRLPLVGRDREPLVGHHTSPGSRTHAQ